jgi:3-oxoacyl-[acyl-carrier protein] reductase
MIMLPADRAALVTGASRGLGAVIARHLAGAGWAVAVGYRFDAASAERVVAEIVASGGRARAYGGDITDEAAVGEIVAQASADLGPVLGIVANATGPQPVTPLDALTWRDHLDQLEFFVKSPTLLVQAAAPAMREHRFGRVIMIGSDMVDRAKPGWTAYSAAKAAQIGLVRVWARELGPDGITVNIVAPGWIPVERHLGADISGYLAEVPLGRMGTPQDIASTVGYLCSDAAGFVTAQRITVNGSHTISP